MYSHKYIICLHARGYVGKCIVYMYILGLGSSLQFLDFVRVNFLMQLSKKLPKGLVGLDANWPSAPVALTEASNQLREMYRLHVARKFMRPLTPEDRAQVSRTWSNGLSNDCRLKFYQLGSGPASTKNAFPASVCLSIRP